MESADVRDQLERILLTEDAIRTRIAELCREIESDYAGRDLLLIGVLKGAVMVMADLARELKRDVEMDWMAVSSYGSGTHGFLPPECYEGETSRICPKVDVFSAGVVFFVSLFYPHKPFFPNATQEQIMRMKPHDIRAETQQLEFPGKLSAEAQAFLRRTLNNNRQERPDVLTLLDDPYLARSK